MDRPPWLDEAPRSYHQRRLDPRRASAFFRWSLGQRPEHRPGLSDIGPVDVF